jgi:hypothetical protein
MDIRCSCGEIAFVDLGEPTFDCAGGIVCLRCYIGEKYDWIYNHKGKSYSVRPRPYERGLK